MAFPIVLNLYVYAIPLFLWNLLLLYDSFLIQYTHNICFMLKFLDICFFILYSKWVSYMGFPENQKYLPQQSDEL